MADNTYPPNNHYTKYWYILDFNKSSEFDALTDTSN